jgi:hypothetical protein
MHQKSRQLCNVIAYQDRSRLELTKEDGKVLARHVINLFSRMLDSG